MRQLRITKQITNRETASLDMYLQDIGRVELITAQEEVVLAQKIREGDQKALDKLVKANLRFVVSVSKQYQNQGLSLPDLINEGNMGLIKAARRFDETRGFKFISYAVWWIRQCILQALAEQSRVVRLPLNKIGAINKINRTFGLLEQQLEREPNAEEISEILEMAPADIIETLKSQGRHISMDSPIGNSEDAGNMYDLMMNEESSPDNDLLIESLRNEINRSLAGLTQRETEVITLYYGLNGSNAHTLEEIGEKYDLSRERVRQIKEKAVRRLKHSSKSKLLMGYLG
ncbi:MAG: RNA polymerase sigma factor RpoD/SigA [Bacteroidota bacterium]